MPIELVFVIGIAILLFLCLKVKANAFIFLLATALVPYTPCYNNFFNWFYQKFFLPSMKK